MASNPIIAIIRNLTGGVDSDELAAYARPHDPADYEIPDLDGWARRRLTFRSTEPPTTPAGTYGPLAPSMVATSPSSKAPQICVASGRSTRAA